MRSVCRAVLAAAVLCAGASQGAETAARCEAQGREQATSFGIDGLLGRADAVREAIEARRGDGAGPEIDALLAAAGELADASARARLRIHVARSLTELDRTREAFELLSLAAADADDTDLRLASYAIGYQGELYERAGRTGEAAILARRALFLAQRADALDAVVRWQWLAARLSRAEGDVPEALESYRAAAETLRREPALVGPDLKPLYVELADLLLQRASTAEGDVEQRLLVEARSALEDLKAGELRDYFRDPCLDAQRKTAPDLVPGALVLYPVVLPDRLELIVSSEGRLSRHGVEVGRERFVETARDLRRKATKRTTREYLRPGAQLYEWLIRPLVLDSVETLVVVPGDATRALPLAALYDDRAQKFLIEQVPLAITPGLTLTDPRRIDTRSVKMLAAGVSESVQGYPALAGVRREIQALGERFDAELLLDRDFVDERFRAEVTGRILDVVHVASHAEFRGTGAESFLLTYDGRIPMDQLGQMIRATRFRERGLELLTLSACSTAEGDERAALGLAGVALQAGARSALATLWTVDDEVSGTLMTDFYAHLAEPGTSRAEALRRAQLEILGRLAYDHPYYWAPFLLISSWL